MKKNPISTVIKQACLSLIISSSLMGVANASDCVPDNCDFRSPAEWEPQDSVWITWPRIDYNPAYPTKDIAESYIEALHGSTNINLVVNKAQDVDAIVARLSENNIPQDHITFRVIPTTQFYGLWMRDMGPNFLNATDGSSRKILDWNFNNWGDSLVSFTDEKVDELAAVLLDLPVYSSDMYTEGGNHEVNGKGTLMLSKSVPLHRNPGMSIEDIEEEYKKALNVTNIIWINHIPLTETNAVNSFADMLPGPDGVTKNSIIFGSQGHVDNYVRFVDENTILLAEVSEEDAATHPVLAADREALEAVYHDLQSAQLEDGSQPKIVRLPAAELHYTKRTPIITRNAEYVLSAKSYMNFLISNDVVLVAQYGPQTGIAADYEKDAQAMAVFEQIFPSKTIKAIDILGFNIVGGGIHCTTMQEPTLLPAP